MVYEEARLDVELFGHAFSADRLLDGTIRHPAAAHIVSRAAHVVGAAAQEGANAKRKRYPATGGKHVTPCAMETWAHIDVAFGELLDELAVHASQRQRSRGVHPTNWGMRWRTLLSITMALHSAKAILQTMPIAERPRVALPMQT